MRYQFTLPSLPAFGLIAHGNTDALGACQTARTQVALPCGRLLMVIGLLCCTFWGYSSSDAAETQATAPAQKSPNPEHPRLGSCAPADMALPQGVDPGTGFRMQRYRAPVPTTLPGGCVLSDVEAMQLWQLQAARFIDVYPPKGMGADPLDGNWLITENHDTIPGSVWLPEVGRGFLEPANEAYFSRNIKLLGGADQQAPLVFFCTADCWQSWNAARRAILWQYTNIYWYPEGTDGWREIGGDQVAAVAINFLHSRDLELTPLQTR